MWPLPIAIYPKVIRDIIRVPEAMDLGPGTPNREKYDAIQAFQFPEPIVNSEMALACKSGLWLLHDFLDESHTISQDLDNPTGSYWHAIMHRREPDPSNSKYWWRRVGDHPVLKFVKIDAMVTKIEYTNPYDFVDTCERVRGTGTYEEYHVKKIQMSEWQQLFEYCYDLAIGGRSKRALQ